MTSPIAGNPSNPPVSDPAVPDGVEDTSLGNASTEAQVNFGSERKSRGLPPRPHLPKFDRGFWDDNNRAPARTTSQSASNIPKTIEGIDRLSNEPGVDLPFTPVERVNKWKNSAVKVSEEQKVEEKVQEPEQADVAEIDESEPQFDINGHRIKFHQETPWSAILEYIEEPVPEHYTWAHSGGWNDGSATGDFSDNSIVVPEPTDSASHLSRKSTVAEGDNSAEGRQLLKSIVEELVESQEGIGLAHGKSNLSLLEVLKSLDMTIILKSVEENQITLSDRSFLNNLGINTPSMLRVEPRILEFQPHWCHFAHEETAISIYMRARLITLETSTILSALWKPPPIVNYRTGAPQSITVGDIGYMDSLGGFRTLFNVLQSQEENQRKGFITPDTHQPSADLSDYLSTSALPWSLQRPTIYAENANRKLSSTASDHFSFTCDHPKNFAILILPEGGVMHEFDKTGFTTPNTKEYFRENVFSWYKFAKETRYQGIKNGAIFIITATLHAPVWGCAVSRPSDPTTNRKKQKETPVYHQSGDNEHHYIWDSPYNNLLHCAGPTYDELNAMSPGTLSNRCLAVSPLSIWLDDATWNTYFPGNASASQENEASPGPSHLDVIPPSSSSSNKISIKSLTSIFSRRSATKSAAIRDFMTLEAK